MAGKGILLYSGGLDSLLAAKILLDQKIELTGLHFVLPFLPPDYYYKNLMASKFAESIGLNLRFIRCGHEYMKMVKNPPHGYGKNINPCIDCKIFFLTKAREIMEEENAFFVATGEVVGQRPMSQMKHMLNHIEKESCLKGNLLRPLSAKLLNPTNAEISGIVDRESLFAINGRSRLQQMELANKYNIKEFASPAGGCLFTDKNISSRVKDLFNNHPDYNMIDVYLLTIGRHYRIHENAKIIVARNEKECIELDKYKDKSDYFLVPEFKGPVIFVKGELNNNDYQLLTSIAGRYGKAADGCNNVFLYKGDIKIKTLAVSNIITDNLLDQLRI
jgi:tRNA U34 2-thiouridine synthase MnmA/TrmU